VLRPGGDNWGVSLLYSQDETADQARRETDKVHPTEAGDVTVTLMPVNSPIWIEKLRTHWK
jgi:hypothetical protein